MNQYALVTSLAINFCVEHGLDPPAAWKAAAWQQIPKSAQSRNKPCPRCAFLGLAARGRITGIRSGDYEGSTGYNADYAIAGVDLLAKEPGMMNLKAARLWCEVMTTMNLNPKKKHNGQMDVVKAVHSWNQSSSQQTTQLHRPQELAP